MVIKKSRKYDKVKKIARKIHIAFFQKKKCYKIAKILYIIYCKIHKYNKIYEHVLLRS